MNKQNFYRQEYRRLRPVWRESLSIYRESIDAEVTVTTRLLDVGCGHSEYMRSVYAKTPHTYGLDPDPEALAKNSILAHTVVGKVERIPFNDGFFDLVVLEWVVEHLSDPVCAFQEIHRVLKPGGSVIFITPNIWNYNVWLIRAIPNRFHHFFTRRLYDRREGDTYPVEYKMNSPAKIEKQLCAMGFQKKGMILNGDPSYISFNRPLFRLACVLERLYDFVPSAKVHIIGVYEKNHV